MCHSQLTAGHQKDVATIARLKWSEWEKGLPGFLVNDLDEDDFGG